ncbi:hypothetical protein GCM10023200_30830 [Actinomycetospora chlora]|uniref:DUF3040 domain-containing protein n=1 Tax=Actinomycetospora chlora TaxID=663608 RepID=A0ABP9BAV5_9PSEU
MPSSALPHPGDVEQDDEIRRRVADDRFAALVRALEQEDPRFVRRVSAPTRGRLSAGGLMVFGGLVATVVLGALPLVLGLHLGVPALVVIGAVGCVALPVGVPILLGTVLRRMRPLLR